VTPSRANVRRGLGWLSLATTAALVPKCVLCFGVYAGLGASIGLKFSGREFCSASSAVSTGLDPTMAWAAFTALSAAWIFRERLGVRLHLITRSLAAALPAKFVTRFQK